MSKIHSNLSYIVKDRRSLPKKYARALEGQPKHEGRATIEGKGDDSTVKLEIYEGKYPGSYHYEPGNDIYISVERRLEDRADNRSFFLTTGKIKLSDKQYDYLQVADLNGDGALDIAMKLTGKKKHLLVMSRINERQPIGLGLVPLSRGERHYASIYENEENPDRSCGIIYSRDYYANDEEFPKKVAKAYEKATKDTEADDFNDYLDGLFPYRFLAYRGHAEIAGRNEKIFLEIRRGSTRIRYSSDDDFEIGRGVRINRGRDLDFIVDTVETPEEARGHHVFKSEKPIWMKKKRGVCLVDKTVPFPKGFGSGMLWDFSIIDPYEPPPPPPEPKPEPKPEPEPEPTPFSTNK